LEHEAGLVFLDVSKERSAFIVSHLQEESSRITETIKTEAIRFFQKSENTNKIPKLQIPENLHYQ
jgi:hypothetical protein